MAPILKKKGVIADNTIGVKIDKKKLFDLNFNWIRIFKIIQLVSFEHLVK